MTSFNWRVLSPKTLSAYTTAAKDFETVTGCPVQKADEVSMALFLRSLNGRKLSVNTIRQRLSAVSVLSGVKVELPKRPKLEQPTTLTPDQVRALMATVTDPADRMLLVKVLTLGAKARSVEASDFAAHFAGSETQLSARDVTRKLKRYAKKAGLDEAQISLRVWSLTGRRLMNSLDVMELVALIGHNPETSKGVQWKPLHGIGRRSKSLSV